MDHWIADEQHHLSNRIDSCRYRCGVESTGNPRVGLVGCGAWGSLILRDLRTLGVEVHVAVRTSDSAASAIRAGAAVAGTSLDDLLAAGLDGVIVATPASTHAEVLDALRSLELPMFVEKPLTVDSASARRIADQMGERLFVMDKWRYHAGVRSLRDLRASGALGEDVGFRTTRVQTGTVHEDVNCVWTLLPHDLAIAHEIFGCFPEPISANAVVADSVIVQLDAELRFPDGTPMSARVGIAATSHTRVIRVIGREGVATLADGWDEHVTVTRPDDPDGEAMRVIEAPGEMPLLAEIRMFVDHLRGGPPPVSPGEQAAENVRITETVLELAGVGDLRSGA